MDSIAKRIFEKVDSIYQQQKDFAEDIGLSPSVVSEWRRGKSKSYMKCLPEIAEALKVNVSDFLADSGVVAEHVKVSGEAGANDGIQPISDTDARLLAWFRSLDPKKQKAILTAHDAPEDVE